MECNLPRLNVSPSRGQCFFILCSVAWTFLGGCNLSGVNHSGNSRLLREAVKWSNRISGFSFRSGKSCQAGCESEILGTDKVSCRVLGLESTPVSAPSRPESVACHGLAFFLLFLSSIILLPFYSMVPLQLFSFQQFPLVKFDGKVSIWRKVAQVSFRAPLFRFLVCSERTSSESSVAGNSGQFVPRQTESGTRTWWHLRTELLDLLETCEFSTCRPL